MKHLKTPIFASIVGLLNWTDPKSVQVNVSPPGLPVEIPPIDVVFSPPI